MSAYLLLALTTLSFGANANFSKLAVGEVSPMLLITIRWIGTLGLLLLVAGRRFRAEWPVLRKHWLFLTTMGALGLTSFNAFFYVAAYTTTALNIGIIQGSIPVFVLAGSFLIYKEPVTRLQLLGILVTITGVVLVTINGDWQRLLNLAFQYGDILMVLACLLYTGYSLALKKCPAVDRLALFTMFSLGALIASLPLLLIEASAGKMLLPTVNGWIIIGLVILFPSFLAQLSFIKSVDMIGAARAGVFFNLIPVFAAIIAVSMLGEVFHWYHGVALVLVLGGIGLSEWGKRRNA